MVSLYTALKLMGIAENEVVILEKRHTHEKEFMALRQIREKYDMRRTQVYRIYPDFYLDDGSYKGMKFILVEGK